MAFTRDQKRNTLLRSLRTIESIRPESRQKFSNVLLRLFSDHGILMLFYSGFRDYATQWGLRQKYLAGTGGIAAAPGYSWHNFRRAIDGMALREDGSLVRDANDPIWQIIIPVIEEQGLTSGASFGDKPHMSDRVGTTKEKERAKFPGWEQYQVVETGVKPKDTEDVTVKDKWKIPKWVPWAVGGAATLLIANEIIKTYRR